MRRPAFPLVALVAALPAFALACGSGEDATTSGATTSTKAGTTGSGGATGTTGSGGAGGASIHTATGGAGGASTSTSSSAGGGGSVFDAGLGDFCKGEGAIPIPGTKLCTGDLGKKAFRFAVCSCGDFTSQNQVLTDSMDSGKGKAALEGGSIGVNGTYTSWAPTTVKGALYAGGGYHTENAHEVVQRLACGGAAKVQAPAVADDDVFLAGALTTGAPGDLVIKGKLHTPVAANGPLVTAAGGTVVEPVSVPPPCDCAKPIDVGAIVDAFQASNDDVANGVAPDVLTKDANYPKDVTLPCGRYFLDGITTDNTAALHLTGRTVLALGGDVKLSGPLVIDLAPGASLDLFVKGTIFANNALTLGDPARPAASRVYVAGDSVVLTAKSSLAGNLYLPNAPLELQNELEVWGAIFAKSLTTSAFLKVHYDEAILDLPGCVPLDTPCTDCHSCANPTPACGAGGTCGKCAKDADCCAPLVCDPTGRCVQPPPK